MPHNHFPGDFQKKHGREPEDYLKLRRHLRVFRDIYSRGVRWRAETASCTHPQPAPFPCNPLSSSISLSSESSHFCQNGVGETGSLCFRCCAPIHRHRGSAEVQWLFVRQAHRYRCSWSLIVVYVESPDTPLLHDSTIRTVADKFLGVGETVFDVVQASAVNSGYFKRGGSR